MSSARQHQRSLALVTSAIVSCQRCDRLRAYCQRIAVEKRAAYRDEEYWGKPVPGFGDPRARLLILGLAPAAHGANRTGRVFTGDGVGGSGDFLMAALHRAGFANIGSSTHPDDGLVLTDAYIIAAVRCAPPDNKPLPDEIAACADHLDAEIAALPHLQIVVALGKIAWDAWFQHLARQGHSIRPRPAFGHGAAFNPSTRGTLGTRGTLIGCYHPSRQNTNTGKVTPAMYDDVFRRVTEVLHEGSSRGFSTGVPTKVLREGSRDGSHDDGSHDDGSHHDGSHDDGSHDDGSHHDGSHDDGSHDRSRDRSRGGSHDGSHAGLPTFSRRS